MRALCRCSPPMLACCVLGVVCHTYLPATQEQHDVYVHCVCECVCRFVCMSVSNSKLGRGPVKSEKHFQVSSRELIHSQQRKNVHQPWPLAT